MKELTRLPTENGAAREKDGENILSKRPVCANRENAGVHLGGRGSEKKVPDQKKRQKKKQTQKKLTFRAHPKNCVR